MAPEHDLYKTVGRKLTKRRKPLRASSVQYPARLQEGEDAQDDVTAAKGEPVQHMNQSVFSMIAAARSKVDFNARFEEESSDSDDGNQTSPVSGRLEEQSKHARTQTLFNKHCEESLSSGGPGRPLRESVDDRGLHSLPKLDLRTSEEKTYMSKSLHLPSGEVLKDYAGPTGVTPRDAPVMSMMLEAEAELIPSTPLLDIRNTSLEDSQNDVGKEAPASLKTRLMEIFGFEKPEEVVSEYPCWLLQSVLLQGYMYITQSHICFYAYLPKKSNVIAKSGHLFKRGKQNPKFHRYWFSLKGDVLSYYTDQSRLYFPSGNIDLRYGISASMKGREFTIVTDQRAYHFKADSVVSAKEWVRTLQKVIFRSHNEGDSVKISLPIENVIDIEKSPVSGLAETLKIRVIDSDETYAVEEYFFSFFSFGHDAFNILQAMVNDTTAQKIPHDILSPAPVHGGPCSRDSSLVASKKKLHDLRADNSSDTESPTLHDNVRATLISFSPTGSRQVSPRVSGDWGRRNMDASRKSIDVGRRSADLPSGQSSSISFERGRRSTSTSRNRLSKPYPKTAARSTAPPGSTDSFVHSLEQGTESSAPNLSGNETQASGSQILNGSEVFQTPTIQRLHDSPPAIRDDKRRRSVETAPSTSITTHIKNYPPTRPYDEQGVAGCQRNSGLTRSELSQSNSSPTLHQLAKVGAYPLQRAAGLAGYIRSRSKRMSTLLATESMGYVEKVSGMWAGGRKHYGDSEGVLSDDRLQELDGENDSAKHGDRFREHFALPASEKLQATYFAFLQRVLPLYGKIYVSNMNVCYRSLLKGTKTTMVLPLKDIETVDKEKGFTFGYSGLVIVIRGHEEIFFEFNRPEVRDDCAITILEKLASTRYLQDSGLLTQEDKEEAETAKAENKMLQEARQAGYSTQEFKFRERKDYVQPAHEASPTFFDDTQASILNFKPTESLRITCLTIGSRGDVQPYIALCKRLLEEGHRPKIATHAEFKGWVTKHGIEFATVDGDPAELMRICVENGMFTYSFLKEASVKFRGWIDELLTSAWKACRDTDLLIESPSAMAGIHIAEALGIPYFRAFAMPWTRTRAYPHAFAVPEHKMGGAYNYITYVMFDNIFWKATAGQINRWRKKELGLRSTSLDKLQPNKVPFLYNFSPSVVVPPLDFSDWIRVTGYWFLDEASAWSPPSPLIEFIARARADEKKLVYIGFGSIVVSDPAALTKTVVESVLKADVRCILSKGWSDRLDNRDATVVELPLPPEIHQITSAPHDWLFKQIDAAVHHGGAGTTGASLRAGLPTIIKPFFGDQFFFGSRIEDLGVGICLKKVNVSVFSRALWEATHSQRIITKARILGEQIRKEDGVGTAITAIYRDLEYAKSLIKHRTDMANDEFADGANDEWTLIDGSEPELTRRIAAWEPGQSLRIGGERGRQSLDLGA